MRNFTMKEISEIRAEINNGVVYCGIYKGYGVGKIYLTESGNIGWQHYGSSAVRNADEKLAWLVAHIFEDCDTIVPAEWSDYHINYVPIDRRHYKGIDHSMKHPNVLGV